MHRRLQKYKTITTTTIKKDQGKEYRIRTEQNRFKQSITGGWNERINEQLFRFQISLLHSLFGVLILKPRKLAHTHTLIHMQFNEIDFSMHIRKCIAYACKCWMCAVAMVY